jgi:hypothetical protein
LPRASAAPIVEERTSGFVRAACEKVDTGFSQKNAALSRNLEHILEKRVRFSDKNMRKNKKLEPFQAKWCRLA